MEFKVIKSKSQYEEYCKQLKDLVFTNKKSKQQDKIELLTLLIEDYELRKLNEKRLDPVELTKALMVEHDLNQSELAKIAGIGKSYFSEILNYKKKFSRKVIRNIANHFKIRQEALNKAYTLKESALQ